MIALYPIGHTIQDRHDDLASGEAAARATPQPGTSWQPWRGWGAGTGPPLRVRRATGADREQWPLWLQEINATHPIGWVMEEADD